MPLLVFQIPRRRAATGGDLHDLGTSILGKPSMAEARPSRALLITIRIIDTFTDLTGMLIAWISVPLVSAVAYEVFARYLFNAPTIWSFDVTYMLYGALFMLGAAYALHKGAHIRTDFFWDNFSPRTKGLIDSISYVVFFFPSFTALGIIGYIEASYSPADQRDVGPDAVAADPVAVQVRRADRLPSPAHPGLLGIPEELLHGAHRASSSSTRRRSRYELGSPHRPDHAPGAAGRDLHRRADLLHAALPGLRVRLCREWAPRSSTSPTSRPSA